jgi:hypothetical protein
MASEVDASRDSVILASFENRHAAERMLASFGHEFRKKVRAGHVTAFVVSRNKDGSLTHTRSRVLTASGSVYTLTRIFLSVAMGIMGPLSTLRGAKSADQQIRVRKAHVGSDEHTVHAILAETGPDAALLLVRSDDQEVRQVIAARAAGRARRSWDGSRAQVLAGLAPGSQDDWLRSAVGENS